jgi:uncharacterized DUF497 family protein
MEIEWDSAKAKKNEKKHQVTFAEAASVFHDPLAVTGDDPDHSVGESRFITFGVSAAGNLLTISHTYRNEKIRIISARRATKGEKVIYEEG